MATVNKQHLLRQLSAAGMLSGSIIGAGVFSLPFVAQRAGLLLTIGLLVIATIVYSFIHLMYADVIAGIPAQHRFVGYIRMYLGRTPSFVALLIAVVQMFFVLTIYLILSVSFFRIAAPAISPMTALVMFWLFGSITIFIKLRRLALVETVSIIAIVAIIVLLFIASIPKLSLVQYTIISPGSNILLPLSILLFSFSGRVAVLPVVRFLQTKAGGVSGSLVRRSIVLGTLLPAVVYTLFIIGIIALSGSASPDAVSGLVGTLPQALLFCVGLLGLLTLWTSYILLGLDVHDTLRYDLDVPRWLRLFLVVGVPLILYLLGFTNFVGLISFVGGIFLVFEGILIILLWHAARTRRALGGVVAVPRLVSALLWIVFVSACIGVLIGPSRV